MVVFCTKSVTKPLTFRKPTEADWLGSLSRREFVPPDDELEIKIPEVKNKWDGGEGILRKGNEQIIEKYHRQAASRHWRIMRTVLPDAVWENW